jgi:LysR family transcriptional regulator, transcriptional activator of the cysJI operon
MGSSANWALSTPHLRRVLDPLRLQLILELDRRGSISQAAKACSLSQPTASLHLRKLEAATSHRLYVRTARETRLTDAGQLLSRKAETILSMIEGLEQELAALDGAMTGTLRLSVCDTFAERILPPVLNDFVRAHPRAEVQVHVGPSAQVLENIAHGTAELGIAGEIRRIPKVETKPLMLDELVAVAAAPSLQIKAFRDNTLLVLSEGSSSRAIAERALSRAGAKPRRRIELGSLEAVKRSVGAGLGYAILPRCVVQDELERGELHLLTIPGSMRVERWLEVARARHREPTPLELHFERLVRDWLAGSTEPAASAGC